MSISRDEAIRQMVEDVSDTKLRALVLLNETEAEALAVTYGSARARFTAFVGVIQYLDRDTKEKLAHRLGAMANGLNEVKPVSLGHEYQRDAVGAMSGEFRSLADVLVMRSD